MKAINPADLIPMDIFVASEPILTDLAYAKADHFRNIFDASVYQSSARLWAHKDIAAITLLAARQLKDKFSYTMEIYDCLRTVDAQEALQETDIVRAHPEWMIEPRMLAPPGAGAHPRGMAIDVHLLNKHNKEVDMGTLFDDMDQKSYRDSPDLSSEVIQNRKELEDAFMKGASVLGFPFLPLPSEWWDFRFPPEYTDIIKPLYDADLPPQMQMTNKVDNNIPDFDENHFETLADSIRALVDKHYASL